MGECLTFFPSLNRVQAVICGGNLRPVLLQFIFYAQVFFFPISVVICGEKLLFSVSSIYILRISIFLSHKFCYLHREITFQCFFNLHFKHQYPSFSEVLFLGWKQCYLNLHFTHRYPSFPEVLFFGWKRNMALHVALGKQMVLDK